MRLKNKTAIVTGATSGIGRAIAIRFAQEGAKVAAVGRNLERLDLVSQSIKDDGGTCLGIQADLREFSKLGELVNTVIKSFMRLDILVNAAGVFELCDFLDVSEKFYDRTMDVNLKSLFFLSQQVARVMKSQEKGKIINIASEGGGKTGFAEGVPYCASKGAVVSLTQALAVELAPFQINVNAISPGTIRTPMNKNLLENNPEFLKSELEGTPLGRVGEVGDIVPAAVYLASNESDFVTGIQIVVDGGFSSI
jgi:NAD(P)-dependent dehydrogenase (short-subunit alcohol dehydrogenase family)